MDCILAKQTTQQEMMKSTRDLWFPVSKIKISSYFLIFTCDNDVSLQMSTEIVK